MGKTIRFELNRAGVRELLQGGSIGMLQEIAAGVLGRAGSGYAMDSRIGKNRANAMVYADSNEAYRDNLNNNTLLKALR